MINLRKILFAVVLLLLCAAATVLISMEQSEAAAETPQKKEASSSEAETDGIFKVDITVDNLEDYFEYYEALNCVKSDSSTVSSVQVLYGFRLREEYTAADSTDRKDTLKIQFTATGVCNYGQYTVDYDALTYTGTTLSTETTEIQEELVFWPKGDRTSLWQYGVYSSSYINTLENFRVVDAQGCVYLKLKEALE